MAEDEIPTSEFFYMLHALFARNVQLTTRNPQPATHNPQLATLKVSLSPA